MNLTINSYIEALGNTDGRLSSIGRFRLMVDEELKPKLAMPGRGLVDFEVVADDVPCTLRCPLRWDENAAARLHLLAEKHTPGMPDWRVLEGEVTLFDDNGESTKVDVLLRPVVPKFVSPAPVPPAVLTGGDFEELSWDPVWGVAGVMRDGEWSLVDAAGRPLTTTMFEWLGECSEGLVLAQRDGKCGFLDIRGREVVPFIYDDASSFSGGEALVTKDGRSFFISRP